MSNTRVFGLNSWKNLCIIVVLRVIDDSWCLNLSFGWILALERLNFAQNVSALFSAIFCSVFALFSGFMLNLLVFAKKFCFGPNGFFCLKMDVWDYFKTKTLWEMMLECETKTLWKWFWNMTVIKKVGSYKKMWY